MCLEEAHPSVCYCHCGCVNRTFTACRWHDLYSLLSRELRPLCKIYRGPRLVLGESQALCLQGQYPQTFRKRCEFYIHWYLLQNEKWVPPADGHDTIGQYDPAIHSLDGMNAVSLQGCPQPTDERVLRTTSELPDEFPFLLDINSEIPNGIGALI